MNDYRAGFATILGVPNAGKSTLMNALLGEKVAIVTFKPQTTRDRIRGICPLEGGQLILVDTPGVHHAKKALNRYMRGLALDSIADVDCVIYVRDVTKRSERADAAILEAIRGGGKPAICVLNKIDRVAKTALLPLLAQHAEMGLFETLIPLSAKTGDGLDALKAEVRKLLPVGAALYPEDELTDKPVRFLVAELLREQLMLALTDELPWSVGVEVTQYKQREDRPMVEIHATVHVERKSQKGIVVGRGGERMKLVNTEARKSMEELLGQQVALTVHVRVEPNWTTSEKAMKKLGYTDQ